MEVIGKLTHILEPQTGKSERGEWRKDAFVIETLDQYPKPVHITVWNSKADINSFNINDELKVSINIQSREFNEKWYTDVIAWRIEANSADSTPSAQQGTPPPAAPPPEIEEQEDDLPF